MLISLATDGKSLAGKRKLDPKQVDTVPSIRPGDRVDALLLGKWVVEFHHNQIPVFTYEDYKKIKRKQATELLFLGIALTIAAAWWFFGPNPYWDKQIVDPSSLE